MLLAVVLHTYALMVCRHGRTNT